MESLCLSVRLQLSDHVRSISPEPPNYFCFTKLGMVMHYHEAMCPVEKLVYCLKCQGDSEGLYNQNMTSFTIFSKLLVRLQPKLV